MNRIHIFGASGSGVTTLGLALGQHLGIPYFDSDNYFWEKTDPPFTEKVPPEIRNANIKSTLESHPEWIFGGSSLNWGKNVFPDYRLVVFLRIPKTIRLQRIERREYQRYGDTMYQDPIQSAKTQEFLEWCGDYDECTGIANRNIHVHEAWLRNLRFPVLRLEGDLSVSERIHAITDWLKKN